MIEIRTVEEIVPKRFCSEKGEDISIAKNRKREGSGVCIGLVEEKVYSTIKITIDITGVLCAKEEWKEENGAGLLIFKQLDNQEQLSIALISNLIDNIGKKKMFIKMHLRWRYNNVRIKEGDELNIAFSMPEGAFELMVMFFGLTNLLATFQAMINDLLSNMIKAGVIAAFIDDVMVGIETEDEHDDIVEEVLRRMAENNPFVKPEKCVWKIVEVGLLRVVIGPDGVKMEKEKV